MVTFLMFQWYDLLYYKENPAVYEIMPAITPATASFIPYGGCNGHGSGYKEVLGDYGYDKPDPELRVRGSCNIIG